MKDQLHNTARIEDGVFQANPGGFGFVMNAEGEEFFIPARDVNGASHQDTVRIVVVEEAQRGLRAQGQIIEVLERGLRQIPGTFQKTKKYGFVVPDDPRIFTDIYVAGKDCRGVHNGQKVIVRITRYPKDGLKPEGVIEKVLGDPALMDTQIKAIEATYGLEETFPQKVRKEAKAVPGYVDMNDYPDRSDCTNLLTVTIDGEDARDLDDAITLEKKGENYFLGVHIADVSEYVTKGSALDQEALHRGTSVYFPDRVIPMLPRSLSNGICSLNAGELRLALSCFMEFDPKGEVLDHAIKKTLIKVNKRMSYTGVQAILDGREHPENDREDIVKLCFLMKEAAAVLKEKRKRRGAINFDFPESKIVTDRHGNPKKIYPYERNTATDIIEDFMLLANETVAEDYFWQDVPFLYRVHEEPEHEKIAKLATFVRNYGIHMKVGQEHLHPKEIQRLLLNLEGTPQEALVSRIALRSMQKARYSSVQGEHFGLSTRYYTHFTSPIRRYPDLMIHRIIKQSLSGELDEESIQILDLTLPEIASQCSKTERNAMEAEREVIRLMKAKYMEDHLGETFEGVISGVASFGMFVELENTVEGLIPMQAMLDDYYICDEKNYQLIGEETGRVFSLGEKVTIVVTGVNRQMKQIDFMLEEFLSYDILDIGQEEEEAMELLLKSYENK